MPIKRRRTSDDNASFKGMGLAITKLRELRGMTRPELAAKADINPETAGRIERGEVEAQWGTLRRIAYALDISPDDLVREAEKLTPGRTDQKRSESRPPAK